MRICLIALAIAATSGCSGPTSPSSLSSRTPAATLLSSGTPAAMLAISSFEVALLEVSNGLYVYRPALVLSETSSRSEAILTNIVLSLPDGGSYGILVLGSPNPQRVPPGQTWNLSMSNYYPAFVDIDSRSEIEYILVTVSFTDNEGRRGSVSRTAMATK